MKKENVILGYTLDKYNKKYRNKSYQLLRYTKKEVENFDKQHSHYVSKNCKRYLLKGKKWALINDTYYEIPRPIRLAWFRNLNSGLKFLTSFVIAAVIASSIICPTLAFTVWNKGGRPFGPEPTPSKEWYEDSTFINGLKEKDIGLEKELLINDKIHKVRLIGIEHDELADESGGKAHTTWEFTNLICDSDGNSLAYQWNDSNSVYNANSDYINSTIRYALNGRGTNGGKNNDTILVAQKGQTSWSNKYNKTILSMLPNKLQKILKPVKKTVNVYKFIRQLWETVTYEDNLFILSLNEMGDTTEKSLEGNTYKYYLSQTKNDSKVKKQVNNSEKYTSIIDIASGTSGQRYPESIYNYAGYNHSIDNTAGGYYWLRSPTTSEHIATYCYEYNGIRGSYFVNSNTKGIAPAFCL